jgi:hypothetical protein
MGPSEPGEDPKATPSPQEMSELLAGVREHARQQATKARKMRADVRRMREAARLRDL